MARDGDEYNSDREREQRLLDRQTGWKPMASDPTRETLRQVGDAIARNYHSADVANLDESAVAWNRALYRALEVVQEVAAAISTPAPDLVAAAERFVKCETPLASDEAEAHRADIETALAALSTTPAPDTDSYTDRITHEIQSNRGTHNFDSQCPFCFFDHFDAETRANLALEGAPHG